MLHVQDANNSALRNALCDEKSQRHTSTFWQICLFAIRKQVASAHQLMGMFLTLLYDYRDYGNQ